MAGLASRCSRYMVRSSWFAKRSGTVMAARTASGDAGVVHHSATFKASGGFMAGFTSCIRYNVSAWFCFYISEATTMTSCTASGDASVVHSRRYKGSGAGVTSFTLRSRWEVSSGFSLHARSHTMATCTVGGNASVVHRRWFKRYS